MTHFRSNCPVCADPGVQELAWLIPFSRIDPPIQIAGAGGVTQFPMCQTDRVSKWLRCKACESVYLDRVADNQAHGANPDDKSARHYIEKMLDTKHWAGYRARWEWFKEFIPDNAGTFVDAAGAIGQYLTVAKDRGTVQTDGFREGQMIFHRSDGTMAAQKKFDRLIGIDFCEPYVDHMLDLGFEGHHIDLAEDIDLAETVGCKDADFVVFSEAFEHMRYAGDTMARLMQLLRPGGRIFFSAQALGEGLPVRPAETIYINENSLMVMAEQIGMQILKTEIRSGRFFVAGEKV